MGVARGGGNALATHGSAHIGHSPTAPKPRTKAARNWLAWRGGHVRFCVACDPHWRGSTGQRFCEGGGEEHATPSCVSIPCSWVKLVAKAAGDYPQAVPCMVPCKCKE